ncbi:conserved membrane hypothetical protein [Xenorhabdus bovienii str. Intermedium]|uniref:Sulfatase N-terminal domain-containing protein n=2 Tax=Xenorhabdus bovienii TaxID=40576 RepID=A0A077QMS1_XENBV|nr:conserved membrane hypothetical protein [Xenorhabdus bovienii str. Intermedium]
MRLKLINNFYLQLLLLFVLFSAIHYSFGYIFRPIYVFSIICVILFINKKSVIYKPFIIFYSIFSAIYFPIGIIYGSPSFNIFTSLMYTNYDEAKGFISNIPYYYYACSLFILALGYIALKIKIKKQIRYKPVFLIFALVTIIHSPLRTLVKDGEFNVAHSGLPEIKFIKDVSISISDSIKEHQRMERFLSEKDTFSPSITHHDYDTFVLIIGESARRDFMAAYGFPIQNTPFLSESNGILFNKFISAASSTQLSLTHTIASYPQLANNIVSLANKTNFHTYWISNQGAVGVEDTPIASIGRKAQQSFFIKKTDSADDEYISDADLLPFINSAINDSYSKKLIIVHLIGSHPPACARTNNHYDTFYQNVRLSCYIQGIKETDKLLSNIRTKLIESNSKWSMMYFSDHGLSYTNRSKPKKLDLAHNSKYKQNFEVPLFITYYDSKHREYITEQRSALNFMSLFSTWIGISEPKIDNSCNMISNEPCKNQDRVLNFNNEIINYSGLQNDPHIIF